MEKFVLCCVLVGAVRLSLSEGSVGTEIIVISMSVSRSLVMQVLVSVFDAMSLGSDST